MRFSPILAVFALLFLSSAAHAAQNEYVLAAIDIVRPLIELAVMTVGPVIVVWLSAKLAGVLKITDETKRKEMEEKIRDALHASAANGLRYALTKAGLPVTAQPTPEILNMALEYVMEKNPETVNQLGASPKDVKDIILSKAPSIFQEIMEAAMAAKQTHRR